MRGAVWAQVAAQDLVEVWEPTAVVSEGWTELAQGQYSVENIKGKLSEHFGESQCFAIVTVKVDDKAIKNQEILFNPFLSVERGKGIMVAEFLIKRGADAILLRKKFEGKGPEYVLSNSDVSAVFVSAETMNEALAEQGVILGEGIHADNYIG